MFPKAQCFRLSLIMLTLAIGVRAEDNASCSNATLHGSYGLRATGTVIGVGDFAAVGRFTFDGKGNLRLNYSSESTATTWSLLNSRAFIP